VPRLESRWIILGTVSLRSLIASFTVHDTGRGIAASRLESIIRPFGRVPGDATRVKDGGLGLALCRELVRLMGGELRGVE
jgi:signal transduction histidine kinase